MMLRISQLKSLLLLGVLTLNGCSWFRTHDKDPRSELIHTFEAKWFKQNSDHALQGPQGEVLPHLFFDLRPEFSKQTRMLNVVITTPENSEHNYRVDLLSGQRYYAYSYCLRPAFNIGHVPRILDQLGTPQKVIVFGRSEVLKSNVQYAASNVKLVGAYVEKSCPEGDCEGKNNWLSRLVYIAVDPNDRSYGDVKDLNGLLQLIDWKDIKANLESIDGQNFSGPYTWDSIKVGPPIFFEEAFDFFKKHSIYMSTKELGKIQKSCQLLYDRLWDEVGKKQEADKIARTLDEVKKKIELRAELKKKNLPYGFDQRFQVFTRKYYDEFSTCGKFVYAGNSNKDRDKFWFLNLVALFYRLHKAGHYYDCKSNSWAKNVYDNRGELVYDLKKGILSCDSKAIDAGMNNLANYLEGLKSGNNEYYHFVDFDNHAFGTHNKLFSWVSVPIKAFSCSGNINAEIRARSRSFPEDVRWHDRYIEDEEKNQKIIF